MQSPAVTAVVLNWHGRAQTVGCLQALAALSYPALSAVVVDNGCREFEPAEVARLFPAAQYVRTEANRGFTGGSNLGMRQALHAGADYVWFLNNDARPEPDALAELLAVARPDPGIAIVGPKILQLQDPRRFDSVALQINLQSGRFWLLGHDEVDAGQYDHLHDTRAVTGCAMLVTRGACERLRGFDEGFFAYLEDADLCLRAREAGLRVAVACRARVLHDRPPASGPRQSTASLYYTARNHLLLMQRHGEGGGAMRWRRTLMVVGLNLAYALRGTSGQRGGRVRAVCRGVRDYFRGVTGEAPRTA